MYGKPGRIVTHAAAASLRRSMRLLQYKDLDMRRVKPAFAKVRAAIEAGDFKSPDVKKLHIGAYYRAKLDYSNRLLLQFARHEGETVCLALEVIENHAYDKSRFLRGAPVDEAKIDHESNVDSAQFAAEAVPLRWLHATRIEFELLDKPVVFDDAQEAVRRLPAPVVLVGSAGSGKTAVTLAKLREAHGRVLYVTQSAYLAQSARALYDAHGYDNPAQEAEFLSYREFLETLQVPKGRELGFNAFRGWFDRHRDAVRALGDVDAHALFEEFRGVIGAQPTGPLSLHDYLALGTRQSLLATAAREAAHTLFGRYRQWLSEAGLFDLNLVAHDWRPLANAIYDFIVIDEVQDLTGVQLALVLACLKAPGQFLLCGDSNQIVHPNFFSWAAVKTLFWKGLAGEAAQRQQLQVLQANFRNTLAVTQLANTLLKIKQARFGSIDRESNFLVHSTSGEPGDVTLIQAKDAALKQLDAATRASARHAVIVLRDEDKPAARAQFHTPLVFSVHEAKGLEYPHVLLLGIVSGQRSAYAEVCDGVTAQDLDRDELDYRRAKDKSDKALELYKFYVNALYVAMTRAVESLTIVESDPGHPLLSLLGLKLGEAHAAPAQASTKEEWAQEARKLELQGKEEQARAIRDTFLQAKPVPWTPWSRQLIEDLAPKALDRSNPSAKQKQVLLDYALWHGQQAWVEQLARADFQTARSLAPEGDFGWIGDSAMLGVQLPDWKKQQRAVAARGRRVEAASPAGLCREELQGHPAAVRRPRCRPSDAGGWYAVDAGRARRQRGAGGSTARQGRGPNGRRRVWAHRVAARRQPVDRRTRLRQGGTGAAVRANRAGGHRRAGRRPAGARRASSGRVLGAHADAGRVEDSMVALRCAASPGLEVRAGLLRRAIASGARGIARAFVEGHPAQAQLRQPGAGTRRGRQQLQAGTQTVGAHAQWALPAQSGDAAAPARRLAAGV